MVKLVGLTGGIGAGKSTAAAVLREQGIPVLDADALAREVVEPGLPAHAEIARAWPRAMGADGRVDRQRLAAIVFNDPDSKARLEAITHPRIRERIAAQRQALTVAGHRLAVLEAALLVETGLYRELDGLLVVTADDEARIGRVMARDGCSRESAVARLRAQAPDAEKIRVADYVIDNSGTRDRTRARVLEVLQAITPAATPAT
jgi:dephospho-CoA kinase